MVGTILNISFYNICSEIAVLHYIQWKMITLYTINITGITCAGKISVDFIIGYVLIYPSKW